MKALRYHRYGDSSVLEYEDAPKPVPGPGQVLIKVAATSFNPVDAGIRGGYLAEVYAIAFPHTPGVDVSGTVAEIGAGVGGWNVGDAVVAFLPLDADGAAAQYALAAAESLAAATTSVELADAAAMPVAGLTAWQSLFEIAGLTAGQTVLVNGASGAVGGYAVQLAKEAGAVVTATATERDADRLRGYGADRIVDYLDYSLGPRWSSRGRRSTWCSTWCRPPTSRPTRSSVWSPTAVSTSAPWSSGRRTRNAGCVRSECSCAVTPPNSPGWSAASTTARCESTSPTGAR